MKVEIEKSDLINELCDQYNIEMLMVNSSDEEEEDEIQENFRMNLVNILLSPRNIRFRLPNYIYKQMVRLSSNEFDHIFELIKNDNVFHTKCEKLQLPIEIQLQIVLYRLGLSGDGASTKKIASLFGIGDGGTIQNITRRVFKAILKLKNRFLYWPNERERNQIISATKDHSPGCVGFIDVFEIKLAQAPRKRRDLYLSRKIQYAIKVQAVCDYKLRIRHLTIGYPGSVHDAKIFSNSIIGRYPRRFLSDGQWLAADSAYPLRDFLITPFRKNCSEHSKELRESFNTYFSKYRVKMKNCFGLLKEKFGSLRELRFRMIKEQHTREANDWVMVCCILHNIILHFNSESGRNNENLLTQNIAIVNNRNDLLRLVNSQSIFTLDPS